MKPLKLRLRSAARLLPLFAAVGVFVPAYVLAAPGGPAPETATRQLFNAVQANDFPAVQTSIAAGADVDARNPWGNTAADVAVDKGYFRIAHYLVSIRNFQHKAEPTTAAAPTQAAPAGGDARAALIQARNPAAVSDAKVAASSPTAKPTATTIGSNPAVTAPHGTPAAASAGAGGANPFDPSRPAYGTALPF